MDVINYFVCKTDDIVVECPQCKSTRAISIAAYKGKKHTMKVRCQCGTVFQINLDCREHYRKNTLFEASYKTIDLNIDSFYEKVSVAASSSQQKKKDAAKNCTVKNLSVGGVGLDIWGPHSIEQGDELFLEFKLDNAKQTLVRCVVIVRTVRDNLIGAEFKNRQDVLPIVGFYFM